MSRVNTNKFLSLLVILHVIIAVFLPYCIWMGLVPLGDTPLGRRSINDLTVLRVLLSVIIECMVFSSLMQTLIIGRK